MSGCSPRRASGGGFSEGPMASGEGMAGRTWITAKWKCKALGAFDIGRRRAIRGSGSRRMSAGAPAVPTGTHACPAGRAANRQVIVRPARPARPAPFTPARRRNRMAKATDAPGGLARPITPRGENDLRKAHIGTPQRAQYSPTEQRDPARPYPSVDTTTRRPRARPFAAYQLQQLSGTPREGRRGIQ